MKIDPRTQIRGTTVRRSERAGQSGSDGFAKTLAEGKTASSLSGTAPLGAIDSLLALQEVPDAAGRRAKARQRGETLLDELEEIRLALLLGTLAPAQLERLGSLVAARRETVEDAALQAVLDEIETRAAVELAKLGR